MIVKYKGFEIEAFRDWNGTYEYKAIWTNCIRLSDGLDCGGEIYPDTMSIQEAIKDQKYGIDLMLKENEKHQDHE